MIISVSVGKALDKIQHLFRIKWKTLDRLQIGIISSG